MALIVFIVISLFQYNFPTRVPLSLVNFLCGYCRIQEAFLFFFHLDREFSEIENRMHGLLALTFLVLGCAVWASLYWSDNIMLACVRIVANFVTGSWLLQIAYCLYVHPTVWKLHEVSAQNLLTGL